MRGYGNTLRKIREQKHITLKQLSKGVMSVSFLSKFERGESDISLSYFVQLLEKLSITFEEFFYLHNHFELDHLERFFNEVNLAYANCDLVKINELKKEQLEKWRISGMETFLCNAVMLGVYENIISGKEITAENEELEMLYAYFFKVEVWGYYELRLYNSTMLLMPTEMVVTLSKTAYKKSERYQNMRKINNVIAPILFNTLIYLMGPINDEGFKIKRYKKEADIFFSYLENLSIPESSLYERVVILNLKGLYQIKSGNIDTGVAMINKAIQTLNELGSYSLAKNMETYLSLVLDYAH